MGKRQDVKKTDPLPLFELIGTLDFAVMAKCIKSNSNRTTTESGTSCDFVGAPELPKSSQYV